LGYIDLHNHILPGLDDGPSGMGGALELARAMVGAGFTHVATTPHCFEGDPPAALIKERLEDLQRELFTRGIPLQLLPGAENVLEPLLPRRLEEGKTLTLNHSRFLLVELPVFQPVPPYAGELIFELRLRGCHPILAHPERVAALQKDPGRLYQLVRAGALVQLTLGSLTGLMGSAAARAAALFLANGLGHFLATDAHGAGRLQGLERGLALVDRLCCPGSARLMLQERPAMVLRDCMPDMPAPQDPCRVKPKRAGRRKWFFPRRSCRD
jgi:protein-tyrosine phosphatase